jgi:hypothetical protein
MYMMKRKLWPRFLISFLAVWAAIALFKTVDYIPPSEDRLIKMKLWEFYLIEIPKGWSNELRPLNTMTGVLPRLALSHLVASVLGGLVVVSVVLLVRRLAKTNVAGEHQPTR